MTMKLVKTSLVFCVCLLICSTAGGGTFTFQDGDTNGYAGTDDTTIHLTGFSDPPADRLRVRGYSSGEGYSGLIRFEGIDSLVTLGSGEKVVSATLTLTYRTSGSDDWTPANIDVYPLNPNRGWTGGADWIYYDPNNILSWTLEGAKYDPNDRGSIMDRDVNDGDMGYRGFSPFTVYSDGTEHYFYLDPDVVQGWVDNASNNQGLIVVMNPNNVTYVNFASSEEVTSTQRPKLTIETGEVRTVPDVVTGGLTESQAQTAFENVGLALGTVSTDYSEPGAGFKAAGLVMDQDPNAGTEVLVGSSVDIVVSLGYEPIVVPDVVGMTFADANSLILGAGLTIDDPNEEYDPITPAGSILSQDPNAGMTVDKGSAVHLVISLGPAMVEVPYVVNSLKNNAFLVIQDSGFIVGNVSYEPHDTIGNDRVISQDPNGFTFSPEGSMIHLVVSLGQPVVPNVVGQTEAQAITLITNASLTVGSILYENSLTVPLGDVIDQDPNAFESRPIGTPVNLWVSNGLPQVQMPNLIGMAEGQAEVTLADPNVNLTPNFFYEYDLAPVGLVFDQEHEPNVMVPMLSSVKVYISMGEVLVPDVVGQTEAQAITLITNVSLAVGSIIYEYSLTVPLGDVIDQDPNAFESWLIGTPVNFWVSDGLPQVQTPNLIGMNDMQVRGILADPAVNLWPNFIYEFSDLQPLALVFDQELDPNTWVPMLSSVQVYVSRGIATCDYNGDLRVDLEDFNIIGNNWLKCGGLSTSYVDSDNNGCVDVLDLVYFLDCWLEVTEPAICDFDGNLKVNIADFEYLSGYWLTSDVPSDISHDDFTDIDDLIICVGQWMNEY